MDMVRLSVPGTLPYRDVVLRVVASVCRLVRLGMEHQQEISHGVHVADFDDKVVSAVGEAFNNIAQHAYGAVPGEARMELAYERDLLTIRMFDTGAGFDFSEEAGQELEPLRESHMGLEIIRACMDEVSYLPGDPATPNVLTLTKRYLQRNRALSAAKSSG
jgi:anti-sigma regulatory factor (Ser/Thr protein kinase)